MDSPTQLAQMFLAKWNLQLEDLVKYVRPVKNSETLLLVGSITEGLGNPLSDIDLILIGDGQFISEDNEFDEAVLINDSGFQKMTMNLPNGPEINVDYWRSRDLEHIEQRLKNTFERIQNPSLVGASKLKEIELFDEEELMLLHRIRTGVVLTNPENADRWRQRLLLAFLPLYLIPRGVINHNCYREDTIAQLRYGDPLSALSMLRIAMDSLAGAVLASAGETNIYSKWRVRLLDRYRSVLGDETVDTLTQYLFPNLKADAPETVRQALVFADTAIGDIVRRCPFVLPAMGAADDLFFFVKQLDDISLR